MSENIKKLSTTKLIKDNGSAYGILVGRVVRFKPINTTFGTSLQMKGNFKLICPPGELAEKVDGKIVVRKTTEQEYESNIAYVPGAVETALEVAMADQDPASFKGAEFAFKIFTRENPKSVTKYEWAFEPIVAPNANSDPLAHLLDTVSKHQLALPSTSTAAGGKKK